MTVPRLRSRGAAPPPIRTRPTVVPADPRVAVGGPARPGAARGPRGASAPHRRRLCGCGASSAGLDRPGAVVMVAELVLWTVARFVPLEWAPLVGAAIPIVGALALLVAGRPRAADRWARPPSRSTPRHASAIASRARSSSPSRFPASAGPARRRDRRRRSRTADSTTPAETRPVRPPPAARRARVACGRRRATCSGRASRGDRPRSRSSPLLAAGPGRCSCPNPQDAVIAQQRQVREAADAPGRAARRARRRARDARAPTPTIRGPGSPRSCATSPGSCASSPDQLDVNLARLGSIESDVRAQLDPANEQRAAVADVAEPRAVARGDRQAGGQPRRRSGADAGGPRAARATSSTR